MCTISSTETLSNKSYLDQKDKFPITSSRGNTYIFVFYHYNTNTIMGYATKSRNTADICKVCLEVYKMYKSHGEAPHLHILDNECSEVMKKCFRKRE